MLKKGVKCIIPIISAHTSNHLLVSQLARSMSICRLIINCRLRCGMFHVKQKGVSDASKFIA